VGDARQGVEVRAVPAALDARDLGVTRADELNQSFLAESFVHAVLDEEPGDLTEPLPLRSLGAVLRTAGGSPASGLLGGAADRARVCSRRAFADF
jgi:hypothetical protein